VLSRHLLLVALCFFSPSFFLPCFSPSVTSNPSTPQPSSLFFSFGYIKPSQRHKPSQSASLFFSFGYVKKNRNKRKKEKKENERERIEPENKQKKYGTC
jgi:hypothetical protein